MARLRYLQEGTATELPDDEYDPQGEWQRQQQDLQEAEQATKEDPDPVFSTTVTGQMPQEGFWQTTVIPGGNDPGISGHGGSGGGDHLGRVWVPASATVKKNADDGSGIVSKAPQYFGDDPNTLSIPGGPTSGILTQPVMLPSPSQQPDSSAGKTFLPGLGWVPQDQLTPPRGDWDVYRNAGVDPNYRGTQLNPDVGGKPQSAFERLSQMYQPGYRDPATGQVIGPPVMTKPKWWQQALAAGLGGGIGWVNAAGRVRNPIDAASATEGILHPGYQGRLAEWQSRIEPIRQQAQIEAERAQMQQKAALNQANIELKQSQAEAAVKHGNFWEEYAKLQLKKANPPQTLQQLKQTLIDAGDPPDAALQHAMTIWSGGKVGTPREQDVEVTNQDIAARGGWQLHQRVPISSYNAVLAHPEKPDPAAQENINHWVAIAEDPNSTPEAKALANAKLKRLRENTVTTKIDLTNAQQNQPAVPITPGTREYNVASDLANGRLTMQQFSRLYSYSRDVNKKLDIYQKAVEINPNFNPAMFEMGYTFARNPQTQRQLASLNNVESGVPDLLKFSDLASRSGATILNRAIIPGGIAIGGRKYSDFNTARIAFADELSGALGYGSATDMSREMGFNMTDPNLSPENFRSAIENVVMPFVQRKRASLLGPMGIYGAEEMNPSVQGPGRGAQGVGGRAGILQRHGLK